MPATAGNLEIAKVVASRIQKSHATQVFPQHTETPQLPISTPALSLYQPYPTLLCSIFYTLFLHSICTIPFAPQELSERLAKEAGSTPPPLPKWQPLPRLASLAMVLGVLGMLGLYVMHCIHASSDMYSSPSIVLVTQQK